MYFKYCDRLAELEKIAKSNRILRKPPPDELEEIETARKSMFFWERKFFDLWMVAQSWDGAGKITLDTIKQVAEDVKIPYNGFTRRIILAVEMKYRQRASKWQK